MRRNDQPSRPNAITCSRFSLLKTWLMTTEANFPLRRLCLKPSRYGRFSLDHLWPLLGDHRGRHTRRLRRPDFVQRLYSRFAFLGLSCRGFAFLRISNFRVINALPGFDSHRLHQGLLSSVIYNKPTRVPFPPTSASSKVVIGGRPRGGEDRLPLAVQ
jgi:hypothetical protein